jgi:hypothetical protein
MNSYYCSLSKALSVLRPGAQWAMSNDNYDEIQWMDETQEKPTREECLQKMEELRVEEPMRLLRIMRNTRLDQCDKRTLPDYPHKNDMEREAWLQYRVALRELPSVSSPTITNIGSLDISSVVWPQEP